ncbi:MAG: hypothetical protein ABIC82_01105 [bacterium]
MFHNNQSGFTLSEIIIILNMSLLVFSLIATIYILCQYTFQKSQTRYELIQNARVFTDKITRELKQTFEVATILPEIALGAPSEIMFQNGHNVLNVMYIKYYADGANLMRQELHYCFGSDPENYVRWNAVDEFGEPTEIIDSDNLIGEYINSLSFFGTSNLINIEANFSKNGENNYITTKVAGRNL